MANTKEKSSTKMWATSVISVTPPKVKNRQLGESGHPSHNTIVFFSSPSDHA
jgi:hypothetical protein